MSEYRNIEDLKPHPVNERIYGDTYDHELISSIKKYGFKGSIDITDDGVILSGHRRWFVCQELNYETIPVNIIDLKTNDEQVNYLIKMNQSQRKRTNSQIAEEFAVLQEIEADAAKKRKIEAAKKTSSNQYKKVQVPENFPEPAKAGMNGESRDKAAEKLNAGWSGKTAENALKVKRYADELKNMCPAYPELAEELINTLNEKSVNAAVNEMKSIKADFKQAENERIEKKEEEKRNTEMASIITAKPAPESEHTEIETEPKNSYEIKIDQGLVDPETEPEKKEDPVEFFNPEPPARHIPPVPATPIKKSKFNKTNDNIEWAKWSWNPVTGCLHDCQYCYARDIAVRYNKGDFAPAFHEGRLNAPQFTNIPQDRIDEPGINNVFVCSMADLFGKWVDPEWIQAIIDICREQSQWTYLMLTKNPERYLEFEFPENCWLGASATNQAQFDRAIKSFCQIDHSVKFLSCEPLNEKISVRTTGIFDDYPEDGIERDLAIDELEKYYEGEPEEVREFALTVSNELEAIDWMIIGGRSESMRMPAFQPEWMWVQHLIASADAACVPIYFKPNLTVRPRSYPKSN